MIPRTALEEVYRHARDCYPEECCGFLLGDPVDEVRRVENRQNQLHAMDPVQFPRAATTAYNVGPRDLLALEKSLRSERPVRVIYHSHCEVGAYFSDEDKRVASWDGEPLYPVDYLVVDVRGDGVRGARLFRFDRLRRDFIEVAAYEGEAMPAGAP